MDDHLNPCNLPCSGSGTQKPKPKQKRGKHAFHQALAFASGLAHAHQPAIDFVAAHNATRAEVGVGPLEWRDELAIYALNYSRHLTESCDLVHSLGPYGENLAMASYNLSGSEAVKFWVDEKPFYDYASNSCLGGKECLHYSQVVWRNSTEVGCARVACKNGWWIASCNYYPPGNYVGDRPY